jgi:hypothetical protein
VSHAQLLLAADILGPLVEEVVFLGGATIHVWVTEPTAPPTRATDDVDVICDATTRSDYYRLADRLRKRDLREDPDSAVICRWRHRPSGLAIDVMPLSPDVLGFSNPWYPFALDTATAHRLSPDTEISVATPPAIVATKLAAWRSRGQGDLLASLDLHDVLALLDGHPQLADELATAPADVRAYAHQQLAELRDARDFDYLLQSATAGYGRVAAQRAAILRQRVEQTVELLTGPPGED